MRHLPCLRLAVLLLLPSNFSWAESPATSPALPPRLKRADSFIGIHFDFHAGPDCNEIGRHTTPEMVQNIIDLVHPDYIQIDGKGHAGYASYPTRVGSRAPGYVGDPLHIWREVTAANGVALYLHYSGLWDAMAAQNPGWAVVDAQGLPSAKAVSVWSPYADQLLIPQLGEIAATYGVDGAWIDGDCWAAVPDYGSAALAMFTRSTGVETIPRRPDDPHWFEFLQFQREAYRGYLRRYAAEVKRRNPGFQLCSNWAFADCMPEPVSAPVDFLSGDCPPADSVNSARFSARLMAGQGLPWDLMAWSFSNKSADWPSPQKTAAQLQREAAVTLSLGGGFQVYHKQKRDGSIFPEQMSVMAEVAQFCRERQALQHHSRPVPQIALLMSGAAHYRESDALFSNHYPGIRGVLEALLENQESVEVVTEAQLSGRLSDYPLIVVPEWRYLDPSFKADLVAYAKKGGDVLLVGPRTAALFSKELNVSLEGVAEENTPLHLGPIDAPSTFTGERQAVTLGPRATAFGELRVAQTSPSDSSSTPVQPAASIARLGRGQIAATYFTFGAAYGRDPDNSTRRFLADLVRRLFPDPVAEVSGSPFVDVVLARNHGKLLVNLVNTAGPHRTQEIIPNIPPVGPLTVKIRLSSRPERITLEPGAHPLSFSYSGGLAQVTVPVLAIHETIVLHPEPRAPFRFNRHKSWSRLPADK